MTESTDVQTDEAVPTETPVEEASQLAPLGNGEIPPEVQAQISARETARRRDLIALAKEALAKASWIVGTDAENRTLWLRPDLMKADLERGGNLPVHLNYQLGDVQDYEDSVLAESENVKRRLEKVREMRKEFRDILGKEKTQDALYEKLETLLDEYREAEANEDFQTRKNTTIKAIQAVVVEEMVQRAEETRLSADTRAVVRRVSDIIAELRRE